MYNTQPTVFGRIFDRFCLTIQRLIGVSSLEQAKRFVFNTIIFTSIIFIYSSSRVMKDALMYSVTPGLAGLAKTFLTLPFSIITGFIYDYLFKRFKSDKVFYGSVVFFASYFISYVYIFGPYSKYFPIVEKIFVIICSFLNFITSNLTFGYFQLGSYVSKLLLPLATNFAECMFYTFSELWGTIFISLLFWSFMNSTTSSEDAKKTFILYSSASVVANLLSGFDSVTKGWKGLALNEKIDSVAAWEQTTKEALPTIIFFCSLLATFYYLSRQNAERDPAISFDDETAFLAKFNSKKDKKKASFFDSLNFLRKNQYLGLISVMILGYSGAMYCLECLFKGYAMQILNNNRSAFLVIQGSQLIVLAIINALVMLISVKYSKFFTWKKMVLATPFALLVTGLTFLFTISGLIKVAPGLFLDVIFRYLGLPHVMGLSAWIIFMGSLQGFTCKISKYVFFDVCKEQAFILTTYEERVIGKSAIETIVSRVGKGGISGLVNLLIFGLIANNNLKVATSYISVVAATCIFFMFYAANTIIPLYKAREKEYNINLKKDDETELFLDSLKMKTSQVNTTLNSPVEKNNNQYQDKNEEEEQEPGNGIMEESFSNEEEDDEYEYHTSDEENDNDSDNEDEDIENEDIEDADASQDNEDKEEIEEDDNY